MLSGYFSGDIQNSVCNKFQSLDVGLSELHKTRNQINRTEEKNPTTVGRS